MRGADYAHHITTCLLRFSDLPPSLSRELIVGSVCISGSNIWVD